MTQALILYYMEKRKIVVPTQKVVMPVPSAASVLMHWWMKGLSAAPVINFHPEAQVAPREEEFFGFLHFHSSLAFSELLSKSLIFP